MNKAVKNFMTAMPHTISENSEIKKAKLLMEQYDCHHLPVLEGGHLVGMISNHDLSLLLLTSKGDALKVKDVMSLSPYVVDPDTSVITVAKSMLEQRISSAVVSAKNGSSWGIFTNTDSLKALAVLNG